MYAGSTLTTFSGSLLGAHQKIDRTARRHLEALIPGNPFPSTKLILHFEGNNGPDAIKRKSPAKDEPWHYFQPHDLADTELLRIIEGHSEKLKRAIEQADHSRAAFEAAWLSHAIVDGLTPAHHYPYEAELSRLRLGSSRETRTTIKEKLVMHGDSRREKLTNNWKMWGPKGLFTTHSAFEWGVATVILPCTFSKAVPRNHEIAELQRLGLAAWYRQMAQKVVSMKLYDRFYSEGWTPALARQVRSELAPVIVKAVTLSWHDALVTPPTAERIA